MELLIGKTDYFQQSIHTLRCSYRR